MPCKLIGKKNPTVIYAVILTVIYSLIFTFLFFVVVVDKIN